MRLKMMEPCESGARPIEELAFLLLPAPKVDNDLLQQCANLYSNHYGIWGPNAGDEAKPGSRVKISAEKLRSQGLYDVKRCFVVAAIHPATNQVIGNAFCTRFYFAPGKGDVMWITQLVVHKDWRGIGVGRRLCRLAWDGENTFACGIVSPHPFAVRCLERMAGVPCDLAMTKIHGLAIATASGIDLVTKSRLVVNKSTSVLQSSFFVDRAEIATFPENWQLGKLQDGEEYFALCFPAFKLDQQPRQARRLFPWLSCCFSFGKHMQQ
ncbi:uncharacterized protein [Physcomitrium patens]|uniref:N-acetyltransferase domain-containing protein n=1 Tax=Physcomitrium patens TaxID=3218 RepID=A0A2K1IEV4_PHYPA|nr:uncharacterized protein LOC112277408 [Physcomitrium patens]PNR27808.1 hypothetical protein PHYPA_029960 [Physcomitrium patens]|eukprot:XP_024365404.1 uncharacterized protein LOC112277408 [Physcomitrella patens]